MAATRVVVNVGTTTASITIPTGIEPDELGVVDFIIAATTGAGAMTVVSPFGNVMAAETSAANGKTLIFDFAGGWPLWNASNSDGTPGTGQIFSMTGTTACILHIGYHFEKPSFRRT